MQKHGSRNKDNIATWQELIKPKHWPSWFGVSILYLVSRLPYRCQMAIGSGIGKLMYCLLSRRRRIAATNIKLCFPELTEKAQMKLVKKTFSSVGKAIVETGIAWFWPERKIRKLMFTRNIQHINELLKQNKGVILMGGHYTTLDLAGRMCGIIHPTHVVAREQNNLVVDTLLKRNRNLSMLKVIHRHNMRGIIKSLKQNIPVWYAPDQDYGPKHSLFAPFFGIPTATITAMARIAKATDAPVLPVSYFRREDGAGYDLTVYPKLDHFPSGDMEADLTHMNQVLEKIIRQYPDQYLWLHRRFKTRPEGDKSFY